MSIPKPSTGSARLLKTHVELLSLRLTAQEAVNDVVDLLAPKVSRGKDETDRQYRSRLVRIADLVGLNKQRNDLLDRFKWIVEKVEVAATAAGSDIPAVVRTALDADLASGDYEAKARALKGNTLPVLEASSRVNSAMSDFHGAFLTGLGKATERRTGRFLLETLKDHFELRRTTQASIDTHSYLFAGERLEALRKSGLQGQPGLDAISALKLRVDKTVVASNRGLGRYLVTVYRSRNKAEFLQLIEEAKLQRAELETARPLLDDLDGSLAGLNGSVAQLDQLNADIALSQPVWTAYIPTKAAAEKLKELEIESSGEQAIIDILDVANLAVHFERPPLTLERALPTVQ